VFFGPKIPRCAPGSGPDKLATKWAVLTGCHRNDGASVNESLSAVRFVDITTDVVVVTVEDYLLVFHFFVLFAVNCITMKLLVFFGK